MDDVPETASNISTGSTPNTGNGFMAGNESDSAPTPTSTHSLDSVGTGSAGGSPTAPVRIPGRIGPRNRDGRKRVSGIDPSTLWFDPSDVIMIVDGEQLLEIRADGRPARYAAIPPLDPTAVLPRSRGARRHRGARDV